MRITCTCAFTSSQPRVHLRVHLHVHFICTFTRARSNEHLAVNQAAKWPVLAMKASMSNGVKGFS